MATSLPAPLKCSLPTYRPVLVCPDQYTIQLDECLPGDCRPTGICQRLQRQLRNYGMGSSAFEFDCNFVGSMFMVLTVYDEAGNSDFVLNPSLL